MGFLCVDVFAQINKPQYSGCKGCAVCPGQACAVLDHNQATGATPQSYWQRSSSLWECPWILKTNNTRAWQTHGIVVRMHKELLTEMQVRIWPKSCSRLIPLFLSNCLSHTVWRPHLPWKSITLTEAEMYQYLVIQMLIMSIMQVHTTSSSEK